MAALEDKVGGGEAGTSHQWIETFLGRAAHIAAERASDTPRRISPARWDKRMMTGGRCWSACFSIRYHS
jgi:hypothetical protein